MTGTGRAEIRARLAFALLCELVAADVWDADPYRLADAALRALSADGKEDQ